MKKIIAFFVVVGMIFGSLGFTSVSANSFDECEPDLPDRV